MEKLTTSKSELYITFGLIILAAVSRLLPHPFNFTAVGAIALFSGTVIKDRRLAYLLPLFVLLLTDLFLGFHVSMIPVYACFMFTVFIGTVIRKKVNPLTVTFASLLSSLVFFLITNLPFWYADLSLYPLTLNGTLQSYTLAIPFFKNQIAGDLFYNALLFGFYSFVSKGAFFSKKKERINL